MGRSADLDSLRGSPVARGGGRLRAGPGNSAGGCWALCVRGGGGGPCGTVRGGGRERGSGPCPLNSGKTAIAEVGRARGRFFQEWVDTWGAPSPSAPQEPRASAGPRAAGLDKPTSQRRGNPASRGPEPALWRRGARHPPPAAGIPSTLGKSVRKNTCFQKRAPLASRYKGGKSTKL